MRGSGVIVVCALMLGCAGGGEGSMMTTIGSVGMGSTAGSTDSGSAGESATGTAGTSGGTVGADGSDSGSGPPGDASGDTGAGPPCDAVLETFASNPGWSAMGVPDGGTVFGWGPTAFAGGEVGEIGGTLQRAGNDQYYADTGIVIEGGDCITASGRLVAPSEDADFNSVVSFGHFSTTGAGPLIGFSFVENPDSTLRVNLNAGAVSQQVFVLEDIATPRTWSYVYDPTAGTMTLMLEGVGMESLPVAPGDVSGIEAIDAFGMLKVAHDMPELSPGLLTVYLDEVVYSR